MIDIKAIPTRYKGYHFRSRLEARWAVFFDAVGIKWEYEKEGYTNGEDNYLPDFVLYGLPGTNIFVEIKGDENALIKDFDRMVSLLDYGGVLPGFCDSLGTPSGLILLGEIPFSNDGVVFHPIIQHHRGLHKSWGIFSSVCFSPFEILETTTFALLLGLECDQFIERSTERNKWKVEHKIITLPKRIPKILNAYNSARSARFEYGESGPKI